MPVVVDASAIGAIAFGEPDGSTITAHLEGETLIAPALIDYELMNIAIKKARKRPETAGQLAVGLAAALTLPVSRVGVPGLEVLALAAETGLSAYDAAYLWLARSGDIELVTLDRILRRLASDAS
jgi:predicted nucleic acid-binding protein